jgi:hypothetical protein
MYSYENDVAYRWVRDAEPGSDVAAVREKVKEIVGDYDPRLVGEGARREGAIRVCVRYFMGTMPTISKPGHVERVGSCLNWRLREMAYYEWERTRNPDEMANWGEAQGRLAYIIAPGVDHVGAIPGEVVD